MLLAPTRTVAYLMLAVINASLVFACKTHTASVPSVGPVAERELGKDFTIDFNESKTFALCQQTRSGDHMNSVFKYCVISVKENSIVQRGSFQQGSVKWIDNNNIEVATPEKFSTDLKKQIIPIKPSQP